MVKLRAREAYLKNPDKAIVNEKIKKSLKKKSIIKKVVDTDSESEDESTIAKNKLSLAKLSKKIKKTEEEEGVIKKTKKAK